MCINKSYFVYLNNGTIKISENTAECSLVGNFCGEAICIAHNLNVQKEKL